MRDFIEENKGTVILVVCLLLLSLFVSVVGSLVKSGQKQNLSKMNDAIVSIENKTSVAISDKKKLESDMKKSSSGLDVNRVNKDRQIVDTMLRQACSWQNLKEYTDVYNSLVKKYPVAENKGFYDFFIEPSKVPKENGNFNMEYVGIDKNKFMVTKVADNYSYFTEVAFKSKDKNGNGKVSVFAFSCDVSSDGKVFNMYASRIAK